MKVSRRKLSGLLLLLPVAFALGLLVEKIHHEVRQYVLNRDLIAAIKKNDTPWVVSLLSQGADPNVKDLPLETRPAWRQAWDQLRGKRSPKDGTPTALQAALAGTGPFHFQPENVLLVKALLDGGATVNLADAGGNTPLMWAVLSKKQQTVRLLLEKGADVNAKNRLGLTPLYCAAIESDLSLARLLLARGAVANAKTTDGITALHTAALGGQTEMVRLLCESGGDLNARQWDGETPLDLAARSRHNDCVDLLLARGAQR
ncbi:MAG: hypothetical protein JWN14_134 [Chthonomonadales bacterium]|nr:hypothetical protein [Chthonomonadales bacterium]